jgi:hypothetical protein
LTVTAKDDAACCAAPRLRTAQTESVIRPLLRNSRAALGVSRMAIFALAPARSRICAVPAIVGPPRTFADTPPGRAVALSRHTGPPAGHETARPVSTVAVAPRIATAGRPATLNAFAAGRGTGTVVVTGGLGAGGSLGGSGTPMIAVRSEATPA